MAMTRWVGPQHAQRGDELGLLDIRCLSESVDDNKRVGPKGYEHDNGGCSEEQSGQTVWPDVLPEPEVLADVVGKTDKRWPTNRSDGRSEHDEADGLGLCCWFGEVSRCVAGKVA
jgi:hypothetical protein